MNKFLLNEECEYKDIKFNLELEYYFDEDIKEYYVDTLLGNENLRKIRNEYRKIKGLLQDYEIKEIRNQYNLSQRDFAVALGLGEVTITRYESKTVQDKSQDEIIRQSKDPSKFLEYLEQNKNKFIEVTNNNKYNELKESVSKLTRILDYSINQFKAEDRGYTEFKISKLRTIINQILTHKKRITKTYLAKILWYIDCLAYKLNKKSMTGIKYISMPYGAYPEKYDQILNDQHIFVLESWSGEYECYYIDRVDSIEELSIEEQNIIKYVMDQFCSFTTKQLVDYMHQEKAYIETELFSVIPYHYSSSIKIYENYNK